MEIEKMHIRRVVEWQETRTIISQFEMIKEIFSQFLINLIKILSKYKSLETILLTWSIKVLLSTFMVRIISILTLPADI